MSSCNSKVAKHYYSRWICPKQVDAIDKCESFYFLQTYPFRSQQDSAPLVMGLLIPVSGGDVLSVIPSFEKASASGLWLQWKTFFSSKRTVTLPVFPTLHGSQSIPLFYVGGEVCNICRLISSVLTMQMLCMEFGGCSDSLSLDHNNLTQVP